MLEYSREMIDSMVIHPKFDELYATDAYKEVEWRITQDSSIIGRYVQSDKVGIFYVKNRGYMNVAGIAPDVTNTKHYYLAHNVFDLNGVESISDAYYELMADAFTTIKIQNATMCSKVFDKLKTIVTNPYKIYRKGILQKFYTDIVEMAQHMSDANYLVNFTRECTNYYFRNIFINDAYPDGTSKTIIDNDAITVRNVAVTERLVRVDIIPKFYEDKDNETPRFKILYDPLDYYEVTNAENQLREAIRTCIDEEIYQMHEDAYNTVNGLLTHFECDIGFVQIYFNTILLLAEHLTEGYEVTYGNNPEEDL
jgi:hypothetical protein